MEFTDFHVVANDVVTVDVKIFFNSTGRTILTVFTIGSVSAILAVGSLVTGVTFVALVPLGAFFTGFSFLSSLTLFSLFSFFTIAEFADLFAAAKNVVAVDVRIFDYGTRRTVFAILTIFTVDAVFAVQAVPHDSFERVGANQFVTGPVAESGCVDDCAAGSILAVFTIFTVLAVLAVVSVVTAGTQLVLDFVEGVFATSKCDCHKEGDC